MVNRFLDMLCTIEGKKIVLFFVMADHRKM